MKTKSRIEILEYEVCRDCFFELCIPEGDPEMTEEEKKHIERCFEQRAMLDGVNHWCESGDVTNEFSWYPCEICQSKLGGTRYRVIGHRFVQ